MKIWTFRFIDLKYFRFMNKETKQILMSLLGKVTDKDMLDQISDQLFKRGVQTLLEAEMEAHLGYPNG